MPIADNMYYHRSRVESGSCLPVVFIHGAGGTHLHWPSEIRQLPDMRIYSVDLPGHGKSVGHGLQSIEAYAEQIISWMSTIGLHRSVFIGHSMGGAIALTLASKHPEHVLGLGLISTGARLRVSPIILENTVNSQTFQTAVAAIISKSFSVKTDAHLVELAHKRMIETRPSVLHGDFLACHNFDFFDKLFAIRTPTLIVCGQDDELTPLRYSQYLSDHIAGAILHVIPNAGHMVMLEQPHKVAQVLLDFLPGIPFHPGSF
jgi:pimeloyl-ACP methyl ester carboxylesterase